MSSVRLSTPVKALAIALVTGVVVACLAPLVGKPVEERAALWVMTERALVRVGLDDDGTHRTTEPVAGAATSAVRVGGNRLVTARDDALTSHGLSDTLQLGDGGSVGLAPAPVLDLAVSGEAERIWLARPVRLGDDTGEDEQEAQEDTEEDGAGRRASRDRGKGPTTGREGRDDGGMTRITALSRDLVPAWQRQLPGVRALAVPVDAADVAVWALQARALVGLDEQGAPVAGVDLPPGPPGRAFAPLAGDRFAIATARGTRLVDAAGSVLREQRMPGVRDLHPLGAGRTGVDGLWAVGRHRLTLLDEQLIPRQAYHLPAQGIGHAIAAATVDPRDDSLWFVAGRKLFRAHADGRLTTHRDLLAYLGTDRVNDLALYADTFPPELVVEAPEERLVTNNDQPDLTLGYEDTGIGVDTETLNVERDGEAVDGTCETDTETQRIECVIGPFDDGTHTISATVADYAGNESEPVEAIFEIDTVAPTITVEQPVDGAFVNTETITVRGRLSETAELTIDGEAAGLDVDERFAHEIATAADGTRTIELAAEDGAGNRTVKALTVTRDTVAPSPAGVDDIAVEAGEEDGTVRIRGSQGSVEAGAEVVITNTRTDETIVVVANADGAFVAGIAGETGDTYSVRVRDAAGNESEPEDVSGDTGDIPPDPAEVAPLLPETGTPPFEQRISFLYEGTNPIQQEVAPDTIEAERVSILRGEVRDRAGEPIPGVEIRILDHPELGHTATRADGEFDLAVNGGGHLTVEYRKDGYLPVQRTVSTQWNGWYHADDVVMIPLDDKVTTIDLTDDSQPFQVAQGSEVTDSDGTRQATVLFPAGTTAEITLPDGTKKQLSQLDVRATEYTVGDTGPAAMPGELPPASAYTYAVELSVDQAIEQGVKVQGKDVVFNQPVPFYVENFLDFPVGEPVPVGYYNNDTARWLPHENGRIVGILEEQGGLAVLDVTGDGNPSTAQELEALNITDDERAQLATLYAPGESFWRMTTTHLSTWDHNWPYGPPDDGSRPTTALPETAGSDEPDEDCEKTKEDGCVIAAQNQSLGESIDIAGTPYSLHYQSDRAAGSRDNTMTIPLTGDEVPDSLDRVELVIEIAGRRLVREFLAETNQTFEYTWDGLDAFGRPVRGTDRALITLKYIYPCQYYGAVGRALGGSGGGQSIFGQFGGIANPIGGRTRCLGFSFSRESEVTVESPFGVPAAAGGWSLSAEHYLTEDGQLLLLGNGRQRSLTDAVIETVAGGGSGFGEGSPATKISLGGPNDVVVGPDGSQYIVTGGSRHKAFHVAPDGTIRTLAGNGTPGFSGDGGPATEAQLNRPIGIALDPNGAVFIADFENHRIRRIGPDGIIDTVAGTGEAGFSGDGGPATEAQLDRPAGVAVGPDGALYIADRDNHRIRRVAPDGIISTVAGGGDARPGDGGPATEARLSRVRDLSFGPDGSMYLADQWNQRIRKVTPDGVIETVAGDGNPGLRGDGGPATQARLELPNDVVAGPDGWVYIADRDNSRVRGVSPTGRIETVVGGGPGRDRGDGGPAGDANLSKPRGLFFGSEGGLYIADSGNGRIRRVMPGGLREGLVEGEAVPSRDASRLFEFDDAGRHVRTLDAYTDAVLAEFERDAAGRLVNLIDGDGDITRIERDVDGRAVAIVSADGQRTPLTVDDDGRLVALTDPTGATWQMEYTDDGLLTRMQKPDAAINTFGYNGNGRLVEDIDPNGGGWQLSRTEVPDGYRTEMTSGEGRTTRFTTTRPDSRTRNYVIEAPDGTVTTRTHTDSRSLVERPDGTVVSSRTLADPRLGFNAPYPGERRVETPSGLVLEEERSRFTDGSGTVSSLHEVAAINGREYATAYDFGLQQWNVTSPEGRAATTLVDEQSRPLAQSVPGMETVRTQYDSRGRVVSIEQGTGDDLRTTTFAYHTNGDEAGYLASVTDALDRTESFETDATGRVTEQTLPDGRSIGYQYDGRGNLIALTLPGRDTHVFEYDGLDQRTDYTPPDLDGTETVTRYSYNLDRQIRKIERPGGETVTFDYDSGGRLATRRMPVGDTTYGHEPDTGQLSSITAPGGIGLQYQWDGFLPIRTDWSGPVTGTVERGFDNNFWLTQETVNGNPVAFGYDDDGLLTDTGTLELARDTDNGLITGTTQADIAGTRGYNVFGELADRSVSANDSNVYDVEYTRDKLGRITQKTETIGGESHTWAYDYDVAGRLEEARRDGTPVHLYSYDQNGNRQSHTGPSGTKDGSYDAQDRITEYGDATYTHTPAGERTSKTTPQGTTSYDYDAAGNLRAVTLPDGTEIEYLIDGQDRRIGKKVDGTFQKGWLYRDRLNPVAEVDANGNVMARFVYADKPNVPAYMNKDGTTYRIVSDHLGSVRLVIDTSTSEIVQRMDYSPFGKVITDTNPGFQPFGFAGGLYDRDTGLVRFGARDYDPEIGRWTAKDPILFNGSPANLYGYVLNDPINVIDPTGLFPPNNSPSSGPAADAINSMLQAAADSTAPNAPLRVPRANSIPAGVGDVRSYYYLNGIPDPYAQRELREIIPGYDPHAVPRLPEDPC